MKNQKQPLYLAIYSDIREKIAKNTYTDGDYLPSERDHGGKDVGIADLAL